MGWQIFASMCHWVEYSKPIWSWGEACLAHQCQGASSSLKEPGNHCTTRDKIQQHKTLKEYGLADICLNVSLGRILQTYLELRRSLPGPSVSEGKFFLERTGKPLHNAGQTLKKMLADDGRKGTLLPTLIRKTAATHVCINSLHSLIAGNFLPKNAKGFNKKSWLILDD